MSGASSRVAIPVPPPTRLRTLPYAVDAERASMLARIARIEAADCNNGNVLYAMKAFEGLLVDMEASCPIATADGTFSPPDSVEGWAMVLTGPSAVGKSKVLTRVVRDPRLAYGFDEYGPRRPLLAVSAPSPATVKTLGFIMLEALGIPKPRGVMPDHLLLHMVRQALIAQGTLVVLIDEFHHALVARHSGERQKLAETMKNLMKGQPLLVPEGLSDRDRAIVDDRTTRHPVFLILAGTPNLAEFAKDRGTDSNDQFANKCRVTRFEEIPVTRGKNGEAEYMGLKRFVENLMEAMGFPPSEVAALVTPDMLARLYKAACRQLGRVAFLLKEAGRLAVKDGDGATVVSKLPEAFEGIYATGKSQNCFVVADIERCKEPPEPKRKPKPMGSAEAGDQS